MLELAKLPLILLLSVALVNIGAARHHGHRKIPHDDCPATCDKESCVPPTNCLAGMVKDNCDCCYTCGRKESERCDHHSVKLPERFSYGDCGEHLECRLREDLHEKDPAEAICYCKHTDVVCGTDGKTYSNTCQLMEEAYKNKRDLKVATRGPCKSVPWIVSGPDEVSQKLGSNVALACEAMGYPIPSIEWQMTSSDGNIYYLPSDDQHVAVQARGGPEQFEVTGWLQLLELKLEDDGTYYCVAKNSEGETRAKARVMVKQDSSDDNEVDDE